MKHIGRRTIRRSGYSLVEVMIVIAIVAAVSVLVAMFARSMGQTSSREQMIAQHVQELAQLNKAVRTYMNTAKTGWTLGAKNTITVTTLIGAGLLPTNFARRRTVDGETPWGQNYAIAAIKENITINAVSTEVARAVVFETGTALLSRLKRAGYEDTAAAKLGLKRTVAVKAVEKEKLLAGFVAAGSMTSTGSLSAFTKDLTAWIGPTAPTEALVVVLIGFPDLESDGGGGGDGDDDFPYQRCDVEDGVNTNNRACPVGEVEIFNWSVCDGAAGRIYPTKAGTITVGSAYLGASQNSLEAGTCLVRTIENRSPPCVYTNVDPNAARNYQMMIPYTMNNTTVVTTVCSLGTYREYAPPGYIGAIWPHIQTPNYANTHRHRVCCLPK